MSCEKGPNKFARMAGQVSAGISHLAGKRSFYAGLAVGAGGTIGSLALAKVIRKRRQPITIEPVSGTPANPRQISKEALRQASGTRANPKKISQQGQTGPGTKANPKRIPVLGRTPAEIKLQAASIRIQTGSGQPFTSKNSYRVVRPDGHDTGLAITPYVREDDQGQPVEDDRRWGVTHAASGSLISGPYDSLAQAQGLAGRLADLPWTGARLPGKDVTQARQIIEAYKGKNSR
jgi:hypothetical protein